MSWSLRPALRRSFANEDFTEVLTGLDRRPARPMWGVLYGCLFLLPFCGQDDESQVEPLEA
eukprot:9303879-Alexandrium_andersonii.AAC.2